MQTRAPLEEVPSLVEPILEGTLLEIILWFAPEPLCAEDSSNIGNCHFIRRRILRKASVQLSLSSPRPLRHTIVSNEERMAGGTSTPWRESAAGGWSEHGGNITTAFSSSTSQQSAFCNDLTKLILIFEGRIVSDGTSQIESEEKSARRTSVTNNSLTMSNVKSYTQCGP